MRPYMAYFAEAGNAGRTSKMQSPKETGWIRTCRTFAAEQGLDASIVVKLHAFGGPTSRNMKQEEFGGLERFTKTLRTKLPRRIIETLDGEIDRPQAEMFARRFSSVADLLLGESEERTEARVLFIGLIIRTAEVLQAALPRALRVRAVADFYYSQCALIHHLRPQTEEPQHYRALQANHPWQEVAPGVAWQRVEGLSPNGPVHINTLRTKNPILRMQDIRHLREQLSFAEYSLQLGAVAAISGGFFLYSEPDILLPSRRFDPVGYLMDEGKVLNPPALCRATLYQRESLELGMERLGPKGLGLRWQGGHEVQIENHNFEPSGPSQVSAYNRAYGTHAPHPTGVNVVVVGDAVQEVSASAVAIPLAGMVLAMPNNSAPRVGVRVTWLPHKHHGESPAKRAIAGGPMLLLDGQDCVDRAMEDFQNSAPPVTFSQDETFDQNLLPRMAAGIDPDGTLYFCAIDGRDFQRAPGMTLGQTGEWMQALGCERAMNLDGGSSKRMVVNGQVVDLASTEVVGIKAGVESSRSVQSAIFISPGHGK